MLPAELQKADDRYDDQKSSVAMSQLGRPRDPTPSGGAPNERRRSSEDSMAHRRQLIGRDSQELYIDSARRRSYFEDNTMTS